MKNIFFITLAIGTLLFTSCETGEDIIADMDTIVPDIVVATDSMDVNFGQASSVKVTISDPSGIRRIDISYGNWDIVEVIDFSATGDFPLTYEQTINFTVPADSTKSWLSKVSTGYYHNGTTYQYTDYYHDIEIKASDAKLNERTSFASVRVR